MSYKVIPTPDFKRQFKKLAKKYPSLKADLQEILDILYENPSHGISLGHNIYKIRMSISSKRKGKSGGARIITFLLTNNQEIYLIHIFDKSQLDSLTKDLIFKMLKKAGLI